jgi:malate permease and related proteins
LLPTAPDALLITLAMLALGVLFRHARVLPENAAETLNKIVLNLCLPALIVLVVTELDFHRRLLWVPLIAWLVMMGSALMIRASTRWLSMSHDVQGCLLLTAVLGNTAFLGYPLTQAYLGKSSLGAAVLYDQLGSFLVFSSFGLWIAARYGGGAVPSISGVLVKICTFPAFIGLVLGIALNVSDQHLPGTALVVLNQLRELLVPLAMFAVGLNFSLLPPKEHTPALLLGLGIKLLIAPLLAYGLGLLVLDRSTQTVLTFQAAMPPMVTAAALASSARLAPQLAAAMAGFGILISLVWLPLLLQLLR